MEMSEKACESCVISVVLVVDLEMGKLWLAARTCLASLVVRTLDFRGFLEIEHTLYINTGSVV